MTVTEGIAYVNGLARRVDAAATDAVEKASSTWESKLRRATPIDTGALARRWQIRRGPRGLAVVNDRPRARYALKGGAYGLARAFVLRSIKQQTPAIRRDIVRRLRARR